ncbi:MAG TPA: Crp/Fnr family transcriptional regulator [Polyangiaceae bacterium]|jgi:CRP-like cAMP-binding protein
MSSANSPTGNRLLDRLPKADRRALGERCETVALRRGAKVYQSDSAIEHVYFPTTAVCSLVVGMADGEVAEAGMIGNEGMLGLPAYLGAETALHTVLAQRAGGALRMPVEAFHDFLRESPRFEKLVQRYVAYSWRYANQTVACNALHSVEKRACRWLLLTHDRVGDGDFVLTHEFLAEMLGTHRQTVSIVAATLQRSGLIRYRRGVVRILKRAELEGSSCECYAISKQLYRELIR